MALVALVISSSPRYQENYNPVNPILGGLMEQLNVYLQPPYVLANNYSFIKEITG